MPCANQECPQADLVPAFLSTPNQVQAYTGEGESASPSPSPSPSPSTAPASSSGTKNTAVIVGGAVGGVVIVAIIVAVLIFLLCRRRKAKSRAATPVGAPGAGEKSAAYTGSPHQEGMSLVSSFSFRIFTTGY
jgi:hypothetical protein